MTRSQGVVRPARTRDLDRLAALFTLGLEHHADADRFRLRPGAEDAARSWLSGRLAASGASLLVWDAEPAPEITSNLLGLCVGRLVTRPALFEETVRGEIEQLVVRPEVRRRGIGRALADAVFGQLRARGATRVEIQVAIDNREGQAFWRALGFGCSMDVMERAL